MPSSQRSGQRTTGHPHSRHRQAKPMSRPARRTVDRLDRRHIGRGHPAQRLQVVSARGSKVWDAAGKEYVDFYTGWCVGNLGWAHPAIKERLRNFEGPDYVGPHFEYAPWSELAALLADVAPADLKTCFRAVGGTEAVEVALQAAMHYTGRTRFASIEGSYHGNSALALSIAGGGGRRDTVEKVWPRTRQVKPPLDEAALGPVEKALGKGDVAAFVMEPVSPNLGPLVPEDGFMQGLQRLCRENGTLLVMDEVACGFGRTGRLFATEHYAIQPDLLCMGKGITSGHAPLAATIMTADVADAVQEELSFYSTFGWHPLATEAAIATVQHMKVHRDELMENVAARSAQIRTRLEGMDFGADPVIRSKGLAIGVELEDEKQVRRIVEGCRRDGLLLTEEDNVLQLFPAINIDASTVDRGLDVLEGALR